MSASADFQVIAGRFAAADLDDGGVFGKRQERKLVMTLEQAARLRRLLDAACVREAFVPGRVVSQIHSVYFDTADYALARATGDQAKLKLRLRAYGDARTPGRTDGLRFLEAKIGTAGADKRKARLEVGDADVATLLQAGGRLKATEQRKLWRPLLQLVAEGTLAARVAVGYQREAWIDPATGGRFTIDERYRAMPVGPCGTTRLDGTVGTLPGAAIVELKVRDGLPAWLEAAIEELGHDPAGRSFSKLKTAVNLLGL